MKNNFSMYITKPKYGWAGISIFNNKQQMINISASEVFNPFYSFVDVLYFLKGKKLSPLRLLYCSGKYRNYKVPNFYESTLNGTRNKLIKFSIDQEGYDAILTFKIEGNYVTLTTETLRDSVKDKKFTAKFDRLNIIKEIEAALLSFQKYELGEFAFQRIKK